MGIVTFSRVYDRGSSNFDESRLSTEGTPGKVQGTQLRGNSTAQLFSRIGVSASYPSRSGNSPEDSEPSSMQMQVPKRSYSLPDLRLQKIDTSKLLSPRDSTLAGRSLTTGSVALLQVEKQNLPVRILEHSVNCARC